jgi:hypothetical protein
VVSKIHPVRGPRIVMVAGGDVAANPLILTDAPVLVESRSSHNRRLVDSSTFIDGVHAAIGSKVALLVPHFVRSKFAIRIDDIILDQWIAGPAVQRQVSRSICVVGSRICDSPLEMVRTNYRTIPASTYLEPPGDQPLPHTKPPVPCQFTV